MVFFDISVFETTAFVKICKFKVFSSGSLCQIYRATDEALIAETMLWPNFFLIYVFFALKGYKLFIIIIYKWFKPLESFLIDKNEKEIRYVSKISHKVLSLKRFGQANRVKESK